MKLKPKYLYYAVAILILGLGYNALVKKRLAKLDVFDEPPPQSINELSETVNSVSAGLLRPSFKPRNNEKLVMVNVWATWCEPCVAELPLLLKIYGRYQNHGLRVIFISADEPGDKLKAQQLLRRLKFNVPTYIRRQDEPNFFIQLFDEWAGIIPTTLFFDRNGNLVDKWYGDKTEEDFEKKIISLVTKKLQ